MERPENQAKHEPMSDSVTISTKAPWFAAYTRPRHERQVATQLAESHIASFLPTYKSSRRWKDRRKLLEVPLFPSYLFVQMTSENRLDLLRLPGVVGLVSFQGKPAPLPSVEIENLRQGLAGNVSVRPHPFHCAVGHAFAAFGFNRDR
jgi:transcription antitermination factor NusG